jgi:metallo-beta-lactamase family protein
MHLLETEGGYKVLIDCGLDYEDPDNNHVNTFFPFEPEEIDVVVLTHAHVDHSGNLPTLLRQGFKGQIFCTEPTFELIKHLLKDSVSIQNKRNARGKGAKLYGYEWVSKTLDRVVTLPFRKSFELTSGLSFEFFKAGHILGAASIKFTLNEGDTEKTIGFTGDLGQRSNPLIGSWEAMGELVYLVMESTYGNRSHSDKGEPEEVMLAHINDTCIKKGGRLVIPAFSVGRTQSILYTLKQLSEQGHLSGIRVFADSPLARFSTMVHEDYEHLLVPESNGRIDSLFQFPELYTVDDEEDDEDMKRHLGPAIVVSSAGMVEGGRIQQHIANNIENPFAKVLIAGFCAPGTVGAKLLSGQKQIRLKGRPRNVYADIDRTDVYSAHPDQQELLNYVREHQSSRLKGVFLVHGEWESMQVFGDEVKALGINKVELPESGSLYTI